MVSADPTPATDPFATTRWSLVAEAADTHTPQSREALETLCRLYWVPLHAYVRRRVADVHEAQDLTQGFFTRLLERNDFAAANRDRGRFRAYLLTALKHFLLNEWDKARASKRGGGRVPLPLDFDDGESRMGWEPADATTPEQLYECQWASTVLARVFDRLRDEFVEKGGGGERDERAARFEALKPALARELPRGGLAEMAGDLGMGEGALRTAVSRLRTRYRELLRAEIAETVSDPADVDREIAALFGAVRPAPKIL